MKTLIRIEIKLYDPYHNPENIMNITLIIPGDPRHTESVQKALKYGPTTDNPTQLVRILYENEKVRLDII